MINTIEVAPAILAASLADYLSEKLYIYEHSQDCFPYSRHDLRELIRDFLTKDATSTHN